MADLRKIGMEGFALIDKYYGPQRRSTATTTTTADAFAAVAATRRERCCVVFQVPHDNMEERPAPPTIHGGSGIAANYHKGKPQHRSWSRPIKF
ncbi:hypothetical protein HN51_004379 [Arachis hypogaea]|nr:uncharacterized protein DS421_4g116010 [Arachis hypogaea]